MKGQDQVTKKPVIKRQATRLFDLLDYWQQYFPKKDMLIGKNHKGKWKKHSIKECARLVDQLSSGFLEYGIQTNDKVGIIVNNRPEWVLIELALMQIGAITVPMVANGATQLYQSYMDIAQTKFCIVSDESILVALQKNIPAENLPNNDIENIISIDKIEGIDHWESLLKMGKKAGSEKVNSIAANITPSQIATMVCWEDESENPVLVPLSHQVLLNSIYGSRAVLPFMPKHNTFSYLSLSSIFERTMVYTYLFSGCPVYLSHNQQDIIEDLSEVQPHYMTAKLPLLMKIYSNFLNSKATLTDKKQQRFDDAMKMVGEWKNQDRKLSYDIKLNVYRQLILKKLYQNWGKNIQGILLPTETVPNNLSQLFHAAGVPLRQYYGIPQVPIFALDRFSEEDSFPGTIGRALPGVQIKIASDKSIQLKTKDTEDWVQTKETGRYIEDKYLSLTFSSGD